MDSISADPKTDVYFVGAGPGAKDLITVRGRDIIARCDVIIYAGSLVNPALLDYAKSDAAVLNSARMTLEEVIDAIRKAVCEGKTVCRLHTGDPSLYGAVREQMDALDGLGIHYESCPGVTAAFGAAASMDLEYTLPGISQSLILTRMAGRTDVPETESIESWAAHHASMAIYLSTGMLEELSSRLIAGGYSEDTPAAIIYKATWPEEEYHYCTVRSLAATAAEHGIRKTALVLVGDVLSGHGYEKSRLYDKTFSTEFREASQDR
ncbi:MAG: precorrin-4 C(11)-methyltransferase [Mogibacterium sp.]|nr:precorrin-4 C(11)-methyltransferase [Mogibacterium sp.]